jgi:hypothetical protein
LQPEDGDTKSQYKKKTKKKPINEKEQAYFL